jgi:hypothetical protein
MHASAGEPLRYSEIVKEMEGQGVSPSKTNSLLNELSEKGLIFRIEKDRKVFYRFNDFPVKVKAVLSGIAAFKGEVPEEELGKRNPFEILKQNILTLYPKLDLDRILDLTEEEVKAEYAEDSFMRKVIAKFKDML